MKHIEWIIGINKPAGVLSMIDRINKVTEILSRAEKRSAVLLFGLMVVGMLFEMMGIGLILPVIAMLTNLENFKDYAFLHQVIEYLGNPSDIELVLYAVSTLAVVFLLKNLFLAVLVYLQMKFTFALRADVSRKLFSKYLYKPYTFHLQHNSAELIRNVKDEVNLFSNGIVIPGLLFVSETLVFVGILALILIIEPTGTIFLVVLLGIPTLIFTRLTKKHIREWGVNRQFHEGKRVLHLKQGLGGAKDVKLLGREKEFLQKYTNHVLRSTRSDKLIATLQQFPRLWLEVVTIFGFVALVFFMVISDGNHAGIMPVLAVYAASAFRLMPSINRLISAQQQLRYSSPVIDVIHRDMELDSDDAISANAEIRKMKFTSSISIKSVSFQYPFAQRLALNEISLSIQSGESVGFIGPSGSGKSTLIDIILGLLDPMKGTVEVDGIDIMSNLRGWQNEIGYVPQSIYLTDDTLKNNVAFGIPENEIDEVSVLAAVKAAQLNDFVSTLPEGLDTIIGEQGIRLSGGQRQRIGIARALYHDPDVLVLDEATSALDSDTEDEVMQSVSALHGRKTLLIVAHRLATVKDCDRVFNLETGYLKETLDRERFVETHFKTGS